MATYKRNAGWGLSPALVAYPLRGMGQENTITIDHTLKGGENMNRVLGGMLLAAAVLITGCTKKESQVDSAAPAGVTNEVQAMQNLAVSDAFVQNDEMTMADQSIQTFNYGTFGKVDAAITPMRWGRFIASVTKTVTTTTQPGDSIAIALVEKVVTGTLKIQGRTGTGDTVIISKPFTDKSTRNVMFRRVAKNANLYWMNWVPVGSSLVAGGTFPSPVSNAITLTKLQFFLAAGDTITVTDPTSYYLRFQWLNWFHGGRRNLPILSGGDSVLLRATVVSASPDTDLVALRYGFDVLHRRRQMMTLVSQVQNGDNTYTRVFELKWNVHFHRGDFTAAVDAVTKATLYDDTAPYSVSWWGVPYRVN
jgi:hypothetical protein